MQLKIQTLIIKIIFCLKYNIAVNEFNQYIY